MNAFGVGPAIGPTYAQKQPLQITGNPGPWRVMGGQQQEAPSAFKGGMQQQPTGGTSVTKPLPRPGGGVRTPGTGGARRPPPPAPGPNLTRPGQTGFIPQWFQRAHANDVMNPGDLTSLWATRNSRLGGGVPSVGMENPSTASPTTDPTVATKPMPMPIPPAFGGSVNASTGAAPPPGTVAPPGTSWVPGLGFVGSAAPGGAPAPAFQGFGWNSLNGATPALDANGLPQYATQAQGIQPAWDMAGGSSRGQLRKNPQTGAMEILMGSGAGGESYSWQPYDQNNLSQRQNAELFQRYGPNWSSGSGATSMHSADIAQILTEQLGRQPTQQEVYDVYYGANRNVPGVSYNSNRGFAASGAPLAFGGGG